VQHNDCDDLENVMTYDDKITSSILINNAEMITDDDIINC